MNRRFLLKSILLVLAAQRSALTGWIDRAEAQGTNPTWRHGVTKFGDLKYPIGFKKFDYVDPNAPKGGAASQAVLGTYDNFNMVVAGVKARSPSASTLSTTHCWYPRSTRCRASMGSSPKPSVIHPIILRPLFGCAQTPNGMTANRLRRTTLFFLSIHSKK